MTCKFAQRFFNKIFLFLILFEERQVLMDQKLPQGQIADFEILKFIFPKKVELAGIEMLK